MLHRERAPADNRLEELERSRALWEVKIEALVMEAKGSYQAANNAEARTRTMKRHYENADPLDIEGAPEQEVVPGGDGDRGAEEGLPAVRVDVAPDHKTIALRYKFS